LKIQLLSHFGEGSYGDVWKAIDELGRTVAVKIVRESAAVKSSALDHAKALARTSHPNVVSVISLETVEDPDSGERMDAIVMEFLEGVTLETLLQGPKFSVDEARRIGAAIAGAITHIHEQGMEHGDLHETNVMITAGTVKVIDILYTDSLAKLSSRSQAQRLRRDRANLRLTLQHIIAHTDVTTNEATEFGRMVSDKSTASEIGDAFMKVNGAESQTESEQALQRVSNQLKAESFQEGKEHAAVLSAEIPQAATLSLLVRMTNDRRYEDRHKYFLRALWDRLAPEERTAFVSYLGAELDRELPKGVWAPPIRMLWELRREGWRMLTPRFRSRLEQLLLKDVLLGRARVDERPFLATPGSLGTWASGFWSYFTRDNCDRLAENILSLLHKNTHTQNYVGKFFLSILPALAEQTHTADQMVRALRSAVDDDAKCVVEGLGRLPNEWVAAIKREKTETQN